MTSGFNNFRDYYRYWEERLEGINIDDTIRLNVYDRNLPYTVRSIVIEKGIESAIAFKDYVENAPAKALQWNLPSYRQKGKQDVKTEKDGKKIYVHHICGAETVAQDTLPDDTELEFCDCAPAAGN